MSRDIRKIILFRLGDSLWAMPLSEDSQFVSFDEVVALPIDNKKVAGLIYNAGRIITVLNTDKILNTSRKHTKNNICLIFYSHGDFYGLAVDEGSETIDMPNIMTDKHKKKFGDYVKISNNKVYILKPEDIWESVKI